MSAVNLERGSGALGEEAVPIYVRTYARFWVAALEFVDLHRLLTTAVACTIRFTSGG